jgi:arsenate reductase
MDTNGAVRTLAALAQEARLDVFRLLARAGDEGLAAGDIAAELGLPASTLSFHLQHLLSASLVQCTRHGRSLRYALRRDTLNELFFFLGEDCCQGRAALCPPPTGRIEARRREAAATRAGRPTVVFVCSRNSARSQMAEAILRHEAGDRFDARSGGISPRPIHPLALRVLRETGIDTTPLAAKDLGTLLGKGSIHVAIVVCEAANEHCPKLVPFAAEVLYWPFADPVAARGTEHERLAAFRATRDAIAARIRLWLAEEAAAVA